MMYRLNLLLVCLLQSSLTANVSAKLTTKPSDTVIVVGKPAYFDCSADNNSQLIHWHHYPIGVTDRSLVYGFGRVYPPYTGRFHPQLNNLTGASNLLINSVADSDAGKYECDDDGGQGEKAAAQLVVLKSDLMCTSNASLTEVLIGPNSCGLVPEVVHFSCSVEVSGNVQPTLEWVRAGENNPLTEKDGISRENDLLNKKTTNLTLKALPNIDGKTFICRTNLDPDISCTSGVVKVWHASNDFSITEKIVGEELNCTRENNLQSLCSYKWVRSEGKSEAVVSNEATVIPDTPGLYRCQVDCTVKKNPCSVSAMLVHVQATGPSTAAQDGGTTSGAFVAILIILILVILVVIAFVIFILVCRKKGKARRIKNRRLLDEGHQAEIDQLKTENGKLRDDIKKVTDDFEAYKGKDGPAMLAQAQAQWAKERDVLVKRLEDSKRETVGPMYRDKPTEKRVIRTKASREENKSIKGLALLNNELYIISQKESAVEVYDSSTFDFLRNIVIKEMKCPEDASACIRNRCLYISESSDKVKEILRVDSDGKLITKWQTGNEIGRLSVSLELTVIATFHDSNKIIEYSWDGRPIRTYDLKNFGIEHPMHAIKLKNKNFVVTHGYIDDQIHRLCEVDIDSGKVAKSFGNTKGSGNAKLSNPTHLAVDREGSIMLADAGNARVILLGSNFEFKKELVTKENKIQVPTRILLDELNGRLHVGDYKNSNRVLYVFEIA